MCTVFDTMFIITERRKEDILRRLKTVFYVCLHIQGSAFNVNHFESRITHLMYTAINKTEHG